MHTDLYAGNMDLLYYFNPYTAVSPYAGFGAGLASYKTNWGNILNPAAITKTTAEMNFYLGSEWKISNIWNIRTELSYHSIDGQFDGIIDNNRKGIFGSDAGGYISISAGLQYYFWKSEPATYGEIYSGIKPKISSNKNYPTLDEINEIIHKNVPIIVEKIQRVESPPSIHPNIELFGINFESGRCNLISEAYPILKHALRVLKENPDIRIEVQGFTDNTGSSAVNQKLSAKRAEAIKQYLVSEGIDGSRITTKGFGDKNPISNNISKHGRALNRRIEFKIEK
jgi:OOP family OmpA-OmpF porin